MVRYSQTVVVLDAANGAFRALQRAALDYLEQTAFLNSHAAVGGFLFTGTPAPVPLFNEDFDADSLSPSHCAAVAAAKVAPRAPGGNEERGVALADALAAASQTLAARGTAKVTDNSVFLFTAAPSTVLRKVLTVASLREAQQTLCIIHAGGRRRRKRRSAGKEVEPSQTGGDEGSRRLRRPSAEGTQSDATSGDESAEEQGTGADSGAADARGGAADADFDAVADIAAEAGGFAIRVAGDWPACLLSLRRRRVKQITKTRVPLVFPGGFEIPVHCFIKIKTDVIPTATSESIMAPKNTKAQVRLDRSYVQSAREGEAPEEVDPEKKIKAYLYGIDIVPITEVDARFVTFEGGPKSIKIIGAFPQNDVPFYMLLGAAEAVFPELGNSAAAAALQALMESLAQKELALIGRYVWRQPYPPKLCLLTVDKKCRYLVLNALPYADDVREITLPSLEEGTESQKNLLVAMVDAADLDQLTEETGCPLYKPNMTSNPTILRYISMAMGAYYAAEGVGEKLGTTELPVMERPDAVDARLSEGNLLAKMAAAFPIEKASEGSAGGAKKRSWKEAVREKEELLAKPLESLSDLKIGASSPATEKRVRKAPLEISPLQPVPDFLAMIAETAEDLTDSAMEKMSAVILQLVFEGGISFYSKAMEALVVFRRAAVEERSVKAFNECLTTLRARLTNENRMLVSMKSANVLPIGKDECHTSTITNEEAERFYGSDEAAVPKDAENNDDEAEDEPETDPLDLLE